MVYLITGKLDDVIVGTTTEIETTDEYIHDIIHDTEYSIGFFQYYELEEIPSDIPLDIYCYTPEKGFFPQE